MARYYEPSTIFLDEIDSIMGARNNCTIVLQIFYYLVEHEGSRRMKTELLI